MIFEIVNSIPTVKDAHSQKASQSVSAALKSHSSQIDALLQNLSQSSLIAEPLKDFKSRFSTTIVVGIGGSSLGVQVMQEYFSVKNFVFIDNVDAIEFEQQITDLKDLSKCLWLFVSKSGETIETLTALELISQFYQNQNLDLAKQSIVITENRNNSLSNWARQRQVPQFEIPLTVGGRYSVLSPVGLVPAALMGLNLAGFEKGAKLALTHSNHISHFVADVLSSFDRKEFITILWSYSSRLKKFGFWWQQLWAESLGKKFDKNGTSAKPASTPIPLVGATDQHSVLQQVTDGPKDKFVIFLRSEAAEHGQMVIKNPQFNICADLKSKTMGHLLKAEADATQESFKNLNISHMTLRTDTHNEETLGFLFMFFQVAVLAIGEALEINPVDQPGVEHGKKLCKQILAERRQIN